MGWMMVRLVLSLLFVAVVLFFAARVAKQRGLGGGGLIEVLARQPVTRTSGVTVLKVADRVFLVGSTETQINLLAEMDPDAVAEAMPESGPPSSVTVGAPGLVAGSVFDRSQWAALMDSLREKTVRRR